jgi:erythromycin esterase-like protein
MGTDVDDLRALHRPLEAPSDLDPLLERVGDARFVLLGEASHGTHEYYGWRAAITRRLIAEHGFRCVAVEGDWPDCAEVDRSVRLVAGAPAGPREALERFERWPQWMWANEDVLEFAAWLRAWNAARPPAERAGFHGLDVYSLWDSLETVREYLEANHPADRDAALRAWRCFEPYRDDPQGYAWATEGLVPRSCRDEVAQLLDGVRAIARAGRAEPSAEAFDAEQNAEVVANAEHYYRTMLEGGPASWNVRDTHMADTLDRLVEQDGPAARAVVWAHNTHVGDARQTDMRSAGLVNLGQLVRERHGEASTVLVGFGGHRGRVVAAGAWGATARSIAVPPAPAGSAEALMREAAGPRGLFVWPEPARQPDVLRRPLPHRAIGVVYDRSRERFGNYVPSILGRRYDAFLHFEETTALHPLHGEPAVDGPRELETFPTGV